MAIVFNICRHQMRNNSFCVIFCLKMQITIESKKSCTVIHRNIFPNSGRRVKTILSCWAPQYSHGVPLNTLMLGPAILSWCAPQYSHAGPRNTLMLGPTILSCWAPQYSHAGPHNPLMLGPAIIE